jgi:hypothetical protein
MSLDKESKVKRFQKKRWGINVLAENCAGGNTQVPNGIVPGYNEP